MLFGVTSIRENSMEATLSIAVLMFTRKWLKNKTKLIFKYKTCISFISKHNQIIVLSVVK